MGMTAVYLAASDYTNEAVLTVDGAVSLVNPRLFSDYLMYKHHGIQDTDGE